MIGFTAEVDISSVIGDLTDKEQRQVPFATAQALNSTVWDIQAGERVRLHQLFELRRPQWAERSVKIVHFAKKSELWAQVGIHPPGSSGDSRADILAKFETDTEKTPRGHTIAVPISARIKRKNSGIISNRDRPAGYNFRQVGNRVIGDRRTFIIKKPDGTGIIFQRVGKGRRAQLVALYRLVTRVRIRPDLHFIPLADSILDAKWESNAQAAMDRALRTAK